MDRLTSMRVFRAVVEQGAFARAARKLRLSNAAVSKHVSTLEEALGSRLLHRTTRSLALTPSGRAYHERATRLLDELDALERDVGSERETARGVLRAAAPMSFGLARLAPALPAFLAAHPAVEVDLALTDRFVDVVDEGVDVAIRIAASLPDSSLVAVKLGEAPRLVVASPSYLATRPKLRTPADLAAHACLRFTRGGDPDTWSFRGPDGEVVARVRGPLGADSSLALRAAALAGAGVLLAPAFAVEDDLRAGTLVRCLEGWEAAPRTVFAIYPAARHLSAKVRAFVAFARTTIAGPASARAPARTKRAPARKTRRR